MTLDNVQNRAAKAGLTSRWKIAARVFYLLLLAIIALAALVLLWNSYSGHREWTRTKEELLARGEKLSLAELHPAPIPNEENFFADPLWTELEGSLEKNPSTPSSKVRASASFDRPLTTEDIEFLRKAFPNPGGRKTPGTVLEFARMARKTATSASPTPNQIQSAKALLTWLEGSHNAASHLETLTGRPGAWLPPTPADFLERDLSHFSSGLVIARFFEARAWASLMIRHPAEAHCDVLILLRLANAFSTQPLLLNHLFVLGTTHRALEMIAIGLALRTWTDGDLATFDTLLGSIDLPRQLTASLRGERGFFNQVAISSAPEDFFIREAGTSNFAKLAVLKSILWIYRTAFLDQNQALYNKTYQSWIDHLERRNQTGLRPTLFTDQSIAVLLEHPEGRWNLFVAIMGLQGVPNAIERTVLVQTQIVQTRLACALERYRQKYGAYPETLEALQPEFLTSLPPDPVTLQPMLYRQTAPDAFRLWSVGWNETDEDGQTGKDRQEGDWVWGQKIR